MLYIVRTPSTEYKPIRGTKKRISKRENFRSDRGDVDLKSYENRFRRLTILKKSPNKSITVPYIRHQRSKSSSDVIFNFGKYDNGTDGYSSSVKNKINEKPKVEDNRIEIGFRRCESEKSPLSSMEKKSRRNRKGVSLKGVLNKKYIPVTPVGKGKDKRNRYTPDFSHEKADSSKGSFSPPGDFEKLHDSKGNFSRKKKRLILMRELEKQKKRGDEETQNTVRSIPLKFVRKKKQPKVDNSQQKSKRRMEKRISSSVSFSSFERSRRRGRTQMDKLSYWVRPMKFKIYVPFIIDASTSRAVESNVEENEVKYSPSEVDLEEDDSETLSIEKKIDKKIEIIGINLSIFDCNTGLRLIEESLKVFQTINLPNKQLISKNPLAYELFVCEKNGEYDKVLFSPLDRGEILKSYKSRYYRLKYDRNFLEEFTRSKIYGDDFFVNSTSASSNYHFQPVKFLIYLNEDFENFFILIFHPDLLLRDVLKYVCAKCGLEMDHHLIEILNDFNRTEIPFNYRYKTVRYVNQVYRVEKLHIYQKAKVDIVKDIPPAPPMDNEEDFELIPEDTIEKFPYREYKVIKTSLLLIKKQYILGFNGKTLWIKYPKFSSLFFYKKVEIMIIKLKQIKIFKDNPKKFEIITNEYSLLFEAKTRVEAKEIVDNLKYLIKFHEQVRRLKNSSFSRKDLDSQLHFIRSMDY